MPERPILRLPDGVDIAPPRGPTARDKVALPSRARQDARLGPRFDRLTRAVVNEAAALELRRDADSIAPERAVVFEVAGSIVDFYVEAASIGLEYLADDERAFAPDEDFFEQEHPERSYNGRIYLAMPDLRALRELVRLWKLFKSGTRMPNGFGMWTKLFGRLKDVRAWGPQDRILPETVAVWREQLAAAPDAAIRVEVELWFREAEAKRTSAMANLQEEVAALDGMVIHQSAIPEIRYHAALVELPARRLEELVQSQHLSLGLVDDIMFVRPQSLASFRNDEDVELESVQEGQQLPVALAPIAALLDGMPVQNHVRLRERLLIDDPDGFEEGYSVSLRAHGTEMASLILNGDLNVEQLPLSRPLYVRPVLRPSPGGERTPGDRLLVDLIYRAVQRMKVGEGGAAATAPRVLLVNLSLGDERRPFAGPMSPWARLLDYLAYRHRILFLVSAGNIRGTLSVPEFQTWTEFEEADHPTRERAILNAIHANKATRTLLSPAESLNALTVGAAHDDDLADPVVPHNAKAPWSISGLPNLSSALGLGHRRIVKPDIFMNGGREHVRMRRNRPLEIEPVPKAQRSFGLLAAAPDGAGDLRKAVLTFGTSPATALATRAGHLIHDALMDADGGSMHADVPEEFRALLIKALLVHGAAWGEAAERVGEVFGPHGAGKHPERMDNVARFLGYGNVDTDRVTECAANRATLLGYGQVSPGHAKLHSFPLPPTLSGKREFRAVTVTVAWFSPINPRHQGYRMTSLEAGPGGDPQYSLAIERAAGQPHHHAVKRGSVFHERREGRRASAFVDDGNLLLRVSCRATAGDYEQPVPYAIAISVEVGVESTIEAYVEVRNAMALQVRPPIAG